MTPRCSIFATRAGALAADRAISARARKVFSRQGYVIDGEEVEERNGWRDRLQRSLPARHELNGAALTT